MAFGKHEGRSIGNLGWAALGSLALPAGALAQGSADYETLTVIEAAYLYSGLAMQEMLRQSSLRFLAPAIVVCGVFWLLWRRRLSVVPQPIFGVLAYPISCALVLALFWPEAAGNLGLQFQMLFPGAVTSYIAQSNAMVVQTAGQSGLVGPNLVAAGGARVPRAFDLLLNAVTQTPLRLGAALDADDLERPFERLPVMRQMMNERMPEDLMEQMPRFVEDCYLDAVRRVQITAGGSAGGLSQRVFRPWSPEMRTALGDIEIAEDQGVVRTFLNWVSSFVPGGGGGGAGAISCLSYYQAIEGRVRSYLNSRQTPSGATHAVLYQDLLDVDLNAQVRYFVQRAVEGSMPAPVVSAPGQVVGAGTAGGVVSGLMNILSGWLSGGKAGAAGGAVSALGGFAERMTGLVRTASFVVFWAPWIIGIAVFTLVALFPVVVLWSLFPGQHFKPLINYFLLLVFVLSTPLWWAVVNTVAEMAYGAASPSGGFLEVLDAIGGLHGNPGSWTVYIMVSAIGVVMVPFIQAILLFGTWRAIGGIWSG